ncbi:MULTISPECIES: DUF3037 domain-containing protein [unclassified Halomonas]|uniref:DUF3037 domain-containing protein n=1 Tax=unclassified Halomonas TaxID=2609666 RepID=UPI002884F0D0|nr:MULTISPECIES: DUF3037 domain-containing protein [unclassified Halomonas]MDT0499681.1 DUF3037 domain-containing protein [Halomonas sp. PAR7]MDT0510502.1 DUF3037 domain-containing protein [Halomonas sp. LES1]MDT0589789.1 DUF3037 domain-containing protein [Halomonas sp. PAR8]
MSTICHYAVLRFQPYPETGEFANLGIVMLCSDGTFLYRLETRHYKRITQFFSKLDKKVLLNARRSIADELARISSVMQKHASDSELQLSVFKHLTGPSESLLRFSRPGVIAAAKPEDALEKLFLNYVHHDFSQKPNEEAQLTSQVTKWLRSFRNRLYAERTLGSELLQVKFPLVWEEAGTARQAVKPISFDLEDSSSIIEKGDKWEKRMRRLKNADQAPADTVFVCRAPEVKSGPRLKAYREIHQELTGTGLVRIVPDTLGQAGILQAIEEAPALH